LHDVFEDILMTVVDLREVYERLAARYDAERSVFDVERILEEFHQRLQPLVATNATESVARVLDLGCGAGQPCAAFFVDAGWSVVGVDFCPAMLTLAGQQVPRLQRVLADVRQLHCRDSCCQAVMAVYSLFHVPWHEHGALFKRVYRWLVPGGQFLFTYATEQYTGAPVFEGYKSFLGERLFYSHGTPEQLHRQLAEAGLVVEQMALRQIGGEPFLWVTVQKPIG
jgi:ubiquinone/menaquinone biosynthesis C-methylase UbiE